MCSYDPWNLWSYIWYWCLSCNQGHSTVLSFMSRSDSVVHLDFWEELCDSSDNSNCSSILSTTKNHSNPGFFANMIGPATFFKNCLHARPLFVEVNSLTFSQMFRTQVVLLLQGIEIYFKGRNRPMWLAGWRALDWVWKARAQKLKWVCQLNLDERKWLRHRPIRSFIFIVLSQVIDKGTNLGGLGEHTVAKLREHMLSTTSLSGADIWLRGWWYPWKRCQKESWGEHGITIIDN